MSIQFRTRSQTVINYDSFITNNEITGCCFVFDSNTNEVTQKPDYTASQCAGENGYFVGGDCPAENIKPSSLGCCCSCSLKESTVNPLQTTTLCECESLSGKWTLGACSEDRDETYYCVTGTEEQSNVFDFRNKRACCHPEFNPDGTAYAECTDVCSEKECAEKAAFPYTSTFYKTGRKCNEAVGAGAPVSDECALSQSSANILNSCKNGLNLFCWNITTGFAPWKCETITQFFNRYYTDAFIDEINQTVVKVRSSGIRDIANHLILLPYNISPDSELFDTGVNLNDYAAKTSSSQTVTTKKICPGSLNFNEEEIDLNTSFSGYFAVLPTDGVPIYYRSPNYYEDFGGDRTLSPIPQIPLTLSIDLIATNTFSARIDTSNSVIIYGRFFNRSTGQNKTLNVTTKLKKLYQHNTQKQSYESLDYSTMGFVGQKLDNSFDYFSPYINEIDALKEFRTLIRSLPRREFVRVSLGANTFCGIEEDGTMTCVSLNSDLESSVRINRKYKLVSCTSYFGNDVSNPMNPINDYCFAVDENNRIIKIAPDWAETDDHPDFSNTDVISLSCIDHRCLAAVEPDINVCNKQTLGSCCVCTGDTDITNCIDTSRGNCETLGGDFTSGGRCCGTTIEENCVNCSTIANCGEGFPRSLTITQPELPSSDLTYYKDGLYVGIFEVGTPINQEGSIVNGNPLTGKSLNYRPEVYGYGTTKKKWAIIVAPDDIELPYLYDSREKPEIIQGSLYDGMWNTYGDNLTYYGIQSKSMNRVREKYYLSGWYVPSKNELEFINKKINHGFFIPELFRSMRNNLYLSSTPFFSVKSDNKYNLDSQVFNGKSFMYGQNFNKLNYGDIYLVPRTSNINVRLIRRIEVE